MILTCLCSSFRKLLEQREEELQQQVRSLRLKEASLNRTNAELSHRSQQLDTRLIILEAELSKLKDEVWKHCGVQGSLNLDYIYVLHWSFRQKTVRS